MMGKHKLKDEEPPTPSKKMKKESEAETPGSQDTTEIGVTEMTYSEKVQYASAIASPMAGKKLTKKLLKLVKKAHSVKDHMRSGLREVQARVRKGERGLIIFASDVTPIDVMSHMPAVCEDNNIPYCYVPLRRDISDAMGVRRPTLMALIIDKKGSPSFSQYEDLYNECLEGISGLV
jgi:H/ACA ribonucleoprotein complex subunit 2